MIYADFVHIDVVNTAVTGITKETLLTIEAGMKEFKIQGTEKTQS